MNEQPIQRDAEGSMPKIYVNPRLRPLGDQIKDAFFLICRHWAPLLVTQLIMIFSMAVIVAVAVVAFLMPIVFALSDSITWDNVGLFLMSSYFWIGLCIIIIPIMIFGAWSSAAMIWAIGYKGEEKMAPIGMTLKKGFTYLLPFLWLSIIVTLAYFGSAILLFIPAIILCVGLALSWYIRIYEDVTIMQAIGTSWEISKGYKWSIFGRFFILLLMIWGVTFGMGAIGMIPLVGLFTLPVQFIVNLIITPYALAFAYCIYEDLRAVRKAVYPMRGGLSAAMIIFWLFGAMLFTTLGFLASYLIQRYVI